MFAGMGNVANRVFVFGGKDPKLKYITGKSYEIVWTKEDTVEMRPVNRMFNNRCRTIVACIDFKHQGYEPFLVVVGGSNDQETLRTCELYYPPTDSFHSFPSLNIARENASSCFFKNEAGGLFIYCFGGFDKRAIDDIERV